MDASPISAYWTYQCKLLWCRAWNGMGIFQVGESRPLSCPWPYCSISFNSMVTGHKGLKSQKKQQVATGHFRICWIQFSIQIFIASFYFKFYWLTKLVLCSQTWRFSFLLLNLNNYNLTWSTEPGPSNLDYSMHLSMSSYQ